MSFRSRILLSLFLLTSTPLLSAAQDTTILITAPAPAPTPSTSSSYTSDREFRDAVLNSTNTYRAQHNASDLHWNDTLADYARDWAEGCQFGHSNGPYGENLASGYPSPAAAISAWGNEREDFNFNDPDFEDETGHFTQLVWKNTTAVGCAAVDCSTDNEEDEEDDDDDDDGEGRRAPGWYVVCEYWPRGNVLGAFEGSVQGRVDEGGAAGLRAGWRTLGVWGVAWVVVWGIL
ncbi:PR-1-like protein [Patellaria atrata CBS 101060]|uniref:PR-1-like protein n=1 Tax=Patellaria atrata CBS 101060 TaxID=1346257 RepID=A0A9P4SI07_9PEZI|nr:PR-1-like protein [Patellaria atrata CBS 101060]